MTRMLTRDRATSIGEQFQDWHCRSRSAQVSGPEWRCWSSAWCGKTHFLEKEMGRTPTSAGPFRTRRFYAGEISRKPYLIFFAFKGLSLRGRSWKTAKTDLEARAP